MPKMKATAPDLVVKKRPGPAPVTLTEPDGSSDSTLSVVPTVPSSPASIDGEHHRTFSLKGRPWRRSFSNGGHRDSTPDSGASSFRTHSRKISKSRPLSSSSHLDPLSRRDSVISDDHGRSSLSTADSLSVTTTASSSPIDWKSQQVAGAAPLESDSHLLKTKTPYLVVTTDYLVKMKSRADAFALFPSLATDGSKREHITSHHHDPLLVIPVSSIVSVLVAESTRPSFGIEVWWKSPLSSPLFCRSEFFFSQPPEWHDQMGHITKATRANQQEDKDNNGSARQCQDVEAMLTKIHEAEEPKFGHRKPEIFPVVPRGRTRKEYIPKMEDATKKPQEGAAFYLVVGTYLCHLVQVQKVKGGDPFCRHKSYGLVTLEAFNAEGVSHEERFNIRFRDPFKPPVTLELASRYYRHIIRVFGTADRFLKPVWPQLWQTREIFHVSGIKEPQYLVAREDFGSFRRTLDAYTAAYRCDPVDWEINWKQTRFAPEFRLLPAKRGPYAPLQLLAVLRALRYNDYFNSLSFRDVDLSGLYGVVDDMGGKRLNAAYLSRTCVALGSEEVEILRNSPLLHQEFHALAFCSETIRQIDLRNCSRSLTSQHGRHVPSLQFLTPILNLLRSGITKCNRLLLGGNILPQSDIEDLAETMKTGAIQALDVSSCGLDDASLRDMIITPLSEHPGSLESLSISGNPGRLPARVLPGLLECLPEIRELDLSGSIQGDSYVEDSMLPFSTLQYLEMLEELDISGYKVDEATLADLEQFLSYRSWMLSQHLLPRFRKLSLNHCGITGPKAARLFHAIGSNRGLHLCLSGNPIEHGLPSLTAAIHHQTGPAALDLEMIEFKSEPNYLSLLTALTTTNHLSHLSLAGTAPSPSSHGRCSPELITTLHTFFSQNTSLKSLDLSGFSGKLDDGQLPKGFGRSLSGLAHNHTLTHLRLRNQNLHDDAGTLGRALAENSTLRALDCRDNSLNLTSLRFLVDSVAKSNTTLVEFPFPEGERRAIWKTVLRGLQRTPSSVAVSAMGTISSLSAAAAGGGSGLAVGGGGGGGSGGGARNRDLLNEEERLLRGVLDQQFEMLEGKLRENRKASLSDEAGSQSGHRPHRHRHTSSTGFTTMTATTMSGLTGGCDEEDEDGWPTAAAFTTPPMSSIDSMHLSNPYPAITTDGTGDTGAPDFAQYGYYYQYQDQYQDGQYQDGQQYADQPPSDQPLHQPPQHPPHPEQQQPQSFHALHSYTSLISRSSSGSTKGSNSLDSPAETLDPVSEVETPPCEEEMPELRIPVKGATATAITHDDDNADAYGVGGVYMVGEGETEGQRMGMGNGGREAEEEELFEKMMSEFRATGFGV